MVSATIPISIFDNDESKLDKILPCTVVWLTIYGRSESTRLLN